MTYNKFEIGRIQTDEDGAHKRRTKRRLTGKIIKVRVIYDKGIAPETNLKLFTIEGEKFVELPNHRKDAILYPRHSHISKEAVQSTLQGQPIMERFVSVGPIIVEIDNAGAGGIVKNIIITYKT